MNLKTLVKNSRISTDRSADKSSNERILTDFILLPFHSLYFLERKTTDAFIPLIIEKAIAEYRIKSAMPLMIG